MITLVLRSATDQELRAAGGPAATFYEARVVAGSSGKDVWMAGALYERGNTPADVAHWNGKKWTSYRLPGRGTVYALTVISPKDAWVAGDGTKTTAAYLAHSDGKRWTEVGSPAPPVRDSDNEYRILGFAVAGPRDIWAVDTNYIQLNPHALIVSVPSSRRW